MKTLIRLGGCPGRSESSLGAHAILMVLSCGHAPGNCMKTRSFDTQIPLVLLII